MNGLQKNKVDRGQSEPDGSVLPAWWLVFTRELSGLWVGGRALVLILIFSIMLGVVTYVMASNSELSLIPPKEMIFELLKIAVASGGFISLIIGADMISGERERATLEWLLLTPANRNQIMIGKFLATVSPWPAAMIITIPYLYLAAQGDNSFGLAVFWGLSLGSLLAIALAGLGMLISVWCNSNKMSFFASMGTYLLILVPTQLPGTAQTGAMSRLLKRVSPMESIYHFLEKTIVNNRPLEELTVFLLSPTIFAILATGLLLLYASPGLRLEAGRESKLWAYLSRVTGLFTILAILMSSTIYTPALAFQSDSPANNSLQIGISIDRESAVVNAGDPVLYSTLVTNVGSADSPELIVAMNIINLESEGDVVDPEDWSPERTQYLETLAPGESINLSWRINAILAGDYIVYMVLLPKPESQQGTSHPITSSGIHLTVNAFARINPLGVLPYIVGTPLVLAVGIYLVYRARRRAVDQGGP